MKKLAIVVLAAITLAGCNPSGSDAVRVAKKEISSGLKDPDSVQFRDVFFHPDIEQPKSGASGYVCGQLNAKNSYGAYIGFERFYIHISAKAKWLMPLLGISYDVGDAGMIDDGDKVQTRLDKLLMYTARCEK